MQKRKKAKSIQQQKNEKYWNPDIKASCAKRRHISTVVDVKWGFWLTPFFLIFTSPSPQKSSNSQFPHFLLIKNQHKPKFSAKENTGRKKNHKKVNPYFKQFLIHLIFSTQFSSAECSNVLQKTNPKTQPLLRLIFQSSGSFFNFSTLSIFQASFEVRSLYIQLTVTSLSYFIKMIIKGLKTDCMSVTVSC